MYQIARETILEIEAVKAGGKMETVIEPEEIVWEKTVTAEGKVEKRRKMTEGDQVLHGAFGAPRRRGPKAK